jgi:tetratricopeptide (TPR) repeat protein
MDEQEAGTESSQEKLENGPSEGVSAAEGSEAISSGNERDSQEGRSGDALAWLEGSAFNAPIEEMPTLQWPDVKAEADAAGGEKVGPDSTQSAGDIETTDSEPAQPPDDLEDAMLWLENLAKEQGTPIDEMPTLVKSRERELDPPSSGAAVQSLEQIGKTTPPPMLDSDPMAWLEQLAIDQNSPLEELPSVADRLLASEIVSQFDVDPDEGPSLEPLASQPVELDDALKYLENQAEAQGISLAEVSFDPAEPVESLDADLSALDQMVIAPIAAMAMKGETDPPAVENENGEWDDLSAQIPEDPDEALAWLGELAGEEIPSDSESDRSVLAKGAAVVAMADLVQSDDQALDAEILEGMPDDPDEAMAWMEGLAGHSEDAPANQMVSGVPDDRERPADEVPEDTSFAQNEDVLQARAALSSGDVEAATERYRKLLDGGQGGPALINELETAVAGQTEELELAQLLGDAYMQDGQLQKALKIYRKGFAHL